MSKYGVLSGPYFPAFGLNTDRHGVSLRINFECGKVRTRKNSVFGHFSRNVKKRHCDLGLSSLKFLNRYTIVSKKQ